MAEFAQTMTREMGTPASLSQAAQAPLGVAHIATMLQVLKTFEFETQVGTTAICREPVGVCALITPWNWPVHQLFCKLVPALAAGCAVVLKPSEFSPLSAALLAEVLEAAELPAGLVNLVYGAGNCGRLLAAHPGVDMVSFTGSTRAGIDVAQRAAPSVKRVHQ